MSGAPDDILVGNQVSVSKHCFVLSKFLCSQAFGKILKLMGNFGRGTKAEPRDNIGR